MTYTEEELAYITEMDTRLSYGLDAMWLIITGAGIVFMQIGFMALEVGVVKAKNVKAAIFKNLFDHAIGTLSWYLLGYTLLTGNHYFAAGSDVEWIDHSPMFFPKIFQQYAFAVVASTIVSGATLSRCKLEVYLAYCFFLSGYIYRTCLLYACDNSLLSFR